MPLPLRTAILGLVLAACAASVPAPQCAPPPPAGVLGTYRFPTLHGDTIVFAAEGDLWRVPAAGGLAQRLTTHPAEESHPVLSPDGRTLAFTARTEGPAELYTMPLAGGVPVRLTYEADESIAEAWMPDGRLVYSTRRYSGLPRPRLVAIDIPAGTRAVLPLDYASEVAFDDAGSTVYFVRPAFHRNVTKRYTGGTARRIWKYVPGAAEAVELTGDYRGESHSPSWWRGRVYFVTDRDGTANLWSMDDGGGDLRQHTRHRGWDVKEPALSEGRIVYRVGADLWLYDVEAGATSLVPVALASDLDQLREKWVADPLQYLESAHLHPRGESVVLTARGRVFVAPAGEGRLVRVSRDDSVRLRDAVFLPDGENLLALTDASGEFEFARLPARGVGESEPLTNDGFLLRFRGHPSPDGRFVAYTDKHHDLWVLEIATRAQRLVSENREGVADLAWSPDGRWLAYTMTARNTFRRIQVYDVQEGVSVPVTSDRVNSFAAAWDPKGEFLYFLSDRHLRSLVPSPWGSRQPEPYFDRAVEVFLVALRAGGRSPFQPADELHPAPREEKEKEDDSAAPKPVPRVEIDAAGLARRVKQVPLAAGNYEFLAVNGAALFLAARDSGPDAKMRLLALEIDNEDPKPKTLLEDVAMVEMSLDGEKLLVRQADAFYVVAAKPAKPEELAEDRLDLAGWSFSIDVCADWRQIFVDAWRMERDYFYDPNMHGVDWKEVLARHLPLVERVTTRDELSDLIGSMVGELSALHTSVRGGDLRRGPDDVPVATLGALLVRDPAAGGHRIEYIYQSDPDYPDEASPLADPDLAVHAGDVIEAVNGAPAFDALDLGALLRHQEGRQVRLRVKSGGGGAAPAGTVRDRIVVPAADEAALRYADWEHTRRMAVEAASGGRIGYVHLRAMGPQDITAWYRSFYPVFDRPGLIVDVRANSGGNIDSFLLEKLMRRAWMYWQARAEEPTWNMQYAFRGHMVVLVDQGTASDGEAFAEGFRRLGLGPVIGMRTWGGEIWLDADNRLTDFGLARAPMSGVYGPEGEWLIEQIGVVPDIEVDNLPRATFDGKDAQLEAAIAYLLERIAADPRPVPPPPPFPDRALDARGAGR
ncbi:MAG: S41 family peptidase [Planctomycetota bacterium]